MMNEVPMTPLIQDLSEVSNIVPIDENWLALHERKLEAKKSKYFHASLVDRSGIYIQFINLQPAYLPGAGEVFGGIQSISQIRRKFQITWTSIRAPSGPMPGTNWSFTAPKQINRVDCTNLSQMRTLGLPFSGVLCHHLDRQQVHHWERKDQPGTEWYKISSTLIELINVSRDPAQPGAWAHIINCYVNVINKQGQQSYLRQHPDGQFDNKDPGKAVKRQGNINIQFGGRVGYQGYQKRQRDDNIECWRDGNADCIKDLAASKAIKIFLLE